MTSEVNSIRCFCGFQSVYVFPSLRAVLLFFFDNMRWGGGCSRLMSVLQLCSPVYFEVLRVQGTVVGALSHRGGRISFLSAPCADLHCSLSAVVMLSSHPLVPCAPGEGQGWCPFTLECVPRYQAAPDMGTDLGQYLLNKDILCHSRVSRHSAFPVRT